MPKASEASLFPHMAILVTQMGANFRAYQFLRNQEILGLKKVEKITLLEVKEVIDQIVEWKWVSPAPLSSCEKYSPALQLAPPHTGSPGPFGPENPGRVRKESRKSTPGQGPKVPKECAPESQKSPKRVQQSGFRLFSDSFGTPGRTLSGLLGPCPGVLFRDSFRTLPGFSGPKGPGSPVWGGANCNSSVWR